MRTVIMKNGGKAASASLEVGAKLPQSATIRSSAT